MVRDQTKPNHETTYLFSAFDRDGLAVDLGLTFVSQLPRRTPVFLVA